jgi:murein DD-endopeptidase MepM/ murein hydrolase activator NlpD
VNVPFAANSVITQRFGEHPENYAQFGYAGHEGVDIVAVTSDKTIHCVEDGIVFKDIDQVGADPPNKDYGIFVIVYNQLRRRKWLYAHMSEDFVFINQPLKRGEPIGIMGNTGNTTGSHLHLSVRNTDSAGNIVNLGNGFKGNIDPLPVLDQLKLEEAVLTTANAVTWMPVNNTAALWRFAKANGLQDQQTDELSFTFDSAAYLAQVFNLGIVYCKVGDYGNIRVIPK